MKTAVKSKLQKRTKSFLPVLLIAQCLCMACGQGSRTLPQKCTNSLIIGGPVTSTTVACRYLELTAFPEGIPAITIVLDLQGNAIRNLTDVPVLKNLIRLFLQNNRIETVDWEALGNLPSLKSLSLKRNRLTHVSLDLALQKLLSLAFVSLEFNQLASFTKEQLGHPTLTSVKIRGNPFDCSCAMLWMMTDLKCMHQHYSLFDHCERCDACAIPNYPEPESYKCTSPAHLKGLSLTSVAQQLTNCGDEKLASTTAKTTAHAVTTQYQDHETATKQLDHYLENHNNATSLQSTDRQDSQAHLKGLSLTNVLQHLSDLGDDNLDSTFANIKTTKHASSTQDQGHENTTKHLGQHLEKHNNANSLSSDHQDPTSSTTIENENIPTTTFLTRETEAYDF
ncbi:high affinity nerve growth factor receptor-like [Branchiostoma floridae]|uniref:High affinity nerve growth factor receptor-like n=1 Tax=Branchiostoma floridae TaxID=7739 RepID=A0A9J7MJ19_BRAFL|nr:high affinity nerve growth factor receptor-like [Branchiostoma floridae]